MLIAVLLILLFLFLLLGFPLFFGLIIAPLVIAMLFFPELSIDLVSQQLYVGVTTQALLAVPMFVFAADIMCSGKTAKRLLDFIDSFVGHIHGGTAITAEATCTLFGAISGSAMATMVAIGKPLRPAMLNSGYKDSHIIAMLMTTSNVALLIPPSVVMIMYCVVTGTSVADMFIAGVVPGLLMFLIYALYDYFYARANKIKVKPKKSWKERAVSLKRAILPLGFPAIILGGIYTGFASPTEAAALSVLYALLLEMVIYRTIKLKDICKIAYSAALVTAAVFVLLSAGQVFSWVITYANIPNMLANIVMSLQPSALTILVITSLLFFVACMFVDCMPVILIMIPIIFPIAVAAGVDPIHLGVIVVVQSAIGSITPPFGANIFTACVIFEKRFTEVMQGVIPYLVIFLLFAVLLILVPQISLFLV